MSLFPSLACVQWTKRLIEEPEDLVVDLALVRDKHLRVANGDVDNDYITQLIKSATEEGQQISIRSFRPEHVWELGIDRFPPGAFQLPARPLCEVVSVSYVDANGDTQTLDEDDYQLTQPRGPLAGFAWIAPARDTVWPETQTGLLEAVTIRFRAGYEDTSSPAVANVPRSLVQGVLLLVGEMYKLRSESVHDVHNTPAFRTADRIFRRYRGLP